MLDKLKALHLVDRIKELPGRVKSIEWTEAMLRLVKKPAFITAVGIFLVLVLSAGTYGIWLTQQSPKQPIQFNHKLHLGFGVQCLYCHPGAWKGHSAGLPTVDQVLGLPPTNPDQEFRPTKTSGRD